MILQVLAVVPLLLSVLLTTPILSALGWNFVGDDASSFYKIHPYVYVLIPATLVLLYLSATRVSRYLISWGFLPYFISSIGLAAYSVYIDGGSTSTGLFSLALNNFVASALVLICIRALTPNSKDIIYSFIRIFLAINSVVALIEFFYGHDIFFIPNPGSPFRAGGIIGHPLNCAVFTGTYLIFLLTPNGRKLSLISYVFELPLHVLAIFTFASRSALLIIPIILVVSMTLPSKERSNQLTRLPVLLALLFASSLLFLPISIMRTVTQRFSDDGGSSQTRADMFNMMGKLDAHSLLFGVDPGLSHALAVEYNSTLGIESSWIALIFFYGLVMATILSLSLVLASAGLCRPKNMSAWMMTLFFYTINSGILGFAAKSNSISFLFIAIGCLTKNGNGNSLEVRLSNQRPVRQPNASYS